MTRPRSSARAGAGPIGRPGILADAVRAAPGVCGHVRSAAVVVVLPFPATSSSGTTLILLRDLQCSCGTRAATDETATGSPRRWTSRERSRYHGTRTGCQEHRGHIAHAPEVADCTLSMWTENDRSSRSRPTRGPRIADRGELRPGRLPATRRVLMTACRATSTRRSRERSGRDRVPPVRRPGEHGHPAAGRPRRIDRHP